MHILRLDHATLKTDRLAETIEFYGRFLGMQPGDRPPFDVPGAWLYPQGGDYPLVHVIEQSLDDVSGAAAFDHVAFRGDNILAFLETLRGGSVAYEAKPVPETPFTQVHFHDPNGVKIEMLFEETVAPELLA